MFSTNEQPTPVAIITPLDRPTQRNRFLLRGFFFGTTRKVCHDTEPPDVYDTSLDSVRPRTVGYSPGHVRALSPTPPLTWGGRASARASLEWGAGTGGSLGAVKACLSGAKGGGNVEGHALSSVRDRTVEWRG